MLETDNRIKDSLQELSKLILRARLDTEHLVDILEESKSTDRYKNMYKDLDEVTSASDRLSNRLNVIKNLIEEDY